MSAQFQIGDTVRVLPTECDTHNNLHPNALVTIEHADETHVRVSGSPLEWFARRFELVKRATPAPSLPTQDGDDDGREAALLDLVRQVKAGDAVTLKSDGATLETEVAAVHELPFNVIAWTVRGGLQIKVTGPDAWALTAHQPAPEPEPEWKPGQVAVITPSMAGGKVVRSIRGHQGNWLNEFGGSWDDDEVIDVRPLVVIDPAAVDVDALVEVAHHDRVLYGDTTPDQMRRAILRILAHMGIEATR